MKRNLLFFCWKMRYGANSKKALCLVALIPVVLSLFMGFPSVRTSSTTTLVKIGVPVYSNDRSAGNVSWNLAYDTSGLLIKYFKQQGLLNTQPVFLYDNHNKFDLLVYDDACRRIDDPRFAEADNRMKWAHGNGSNIYVGYEVFLRFMNGSWRLWPPKGSTYWYIRHFGDNSTEIREHSGVTQIEWNLNNLWTLFSIAKTSSTLDISSRNMKYIQYTSGATWLARKSGASTQYILAYKNGVLLDPNGMVYNKEFFTKTEQLKIWEKLVGETPDGDGFDLTLSYAGFKDSEMVISLDDAPRYNGSALNTIKAEMGGKIASLMTQGARMNLGDNSMYEYQYFTEFELHSQDHSLAWTTLTKEEAKADMQQNIQSVEGNLSFTRPYYIWRTPGTAAQTNRNITDAIDEMAKIVAISDHVAKVNVELGHESIFWTLHESGFPYVSRVLYYENGSSFWNIPRDTSSDIVWLRDDGLTDQQKIDYAYGNYTERINTVVEVHGVWVLLGHEQDLDNYPELLTKLCRYAIQKNMHFTTLRGAYQTQLTFDNLNVSFDGTTLTVQNGWTYESVPITVNLHTTIGSVSYNGQNWLFHNGTSIQVPPIDAGSQITMTVSSTSLLKIDEYTTGAFLWEAYGTNGAITYNISSVLNLIGTFTLSNNLKVQTVENVSRVTIINYTNNRLMIAVSAPSGNTTSTKVYCATKGQPSYLLGKPYNMTTDYVSSWLWINATHSSMMNYTLSWDITKRIDYTNVTLTSVLYTSQQLKINSSSSPGKLEVYCEHKPSYILYTEYNLTSNYATSTNMLSLTMDSNYVQLGFNSILLGMRYEAINNGTLSAPSGNTALWRLKATVSCTDTKAKIQIYTNGYRPRYVKIDGAYLDASEWSYNRDTKILTVNVTASPPHVIEAGYGFSDEEIGGTTALGSSLGVIGIIRNYIRRLKKRLEEKLGKTLTMILFVVFAILIVALIIWVLWLVFSVYVFPVRD